LKLVQIIAEYFYVLTFQDSLYIRFLLLVGLNDNEQKNLSNTFV